MILQVASRISSFNASYSPFFSFCSPELGPNRACQMETSFIKRRTEANVAGAKAIKKVLHSWVPGSNIKLWAILSVWKLATENNFFTNYRDFFTNYRDLEFARRCTVHQQYCSTLFNGKSDLSRWHELDSTKYIDWDSSFSPQNELLWPKLLYSLPKRPKAFRTQWLCCRLRQVLWHSSLRTLLYCEEWGRHPT